MDTTFDDSEYDSWAFEPNESSWFARVLFWRPSLLSDDQMQTHFYELDGKWSSPTLKRMAATGARGLDLDANWALTSQRWACPVCKREKSQLFRISPTNILMAKLELHHDHLRDSIWPRSYELFGADWMAESAEGAGARMDAIEALTDRFRPCLVCHECNAAEGLAKARIKGIDRRFSFSPKEIEQFSQPVSGKEHCVDISIATNIWREQRADFEARLGLIDSLLHMVHEGRLVSSHSAGTFSMRQEDLLPATALWKAFYRQYHEDERRQVLDGFYNEFLARSTSKDSPKFASKPRRPVVPITDEEYAGYIDPVSKHKWLETAEEWTCSCCGRSKREIVRKGKSGKWSGGLRVWTDYELETDPIEIENRRQLLPNYENRWFIKGTMTTTICSDCADVRTHLGHRYRNLGAPELSLMDLQDVIVGKAPHDRHEIDWEEAYLRAQANMPLVSALRAAAALRSKVIAFQHRMEFRYMTPVEEVRQTLMEDLALFNQIDHTENQRRLVDWLLQHPIVSETSI